MAKLSKKEAVKIIMECAKQYEKNLLDNTLLFILMDKHKNISSIEVTFYQRNFLHLTGIKINKNKFSADQFFQNCIDGRLGINDFEFSNDGTTLLKLQILPWMMTKNLSANSFGDFNNSGVQLYTEKLAGGVKGCIGFIKDTITLDWVPNTLLNEDLRKVCNKRMQIIATYRKKRTESQYKELVHKAKKINWETIRYPDNLKHLPVPKNTNL